MQQLLVLAESVLIVCKWNVFAFVVDGGTKEDRYFLLIFVWVRRCKTAKKIAAIAKKPPIAVIEIEINT